MALGIYPSYLAFLYFSILFKMVEALNENHVGTDCLDLLHRGFDSTGVYYIDPDGKGAFQVLCDQETNGGGWIVFQKRFNGVVDFDRNWSEYREGFGNFSDEFWLGNEKLHRLTSSMNHQLLVEMETFPGKKAHASYKTFTVDSESEKYRLFVDGYFGTTGGTDSLGPRHNNKMFTTKDSDNDEHLTNCAILWQGGWWFDDCFSAFLNGPYAPIVRGKSISWDKWRIEQLKRTAMKARVRRERPVDYYLSFPGSYPQDFASVPIVLEFEELTVSWWIRVPPSQNWSAVFSIAHFKEDRKVAFLYQKDRQCKFITDGKELEITSNHAFADSKWHLVLLVWKVDSGHFRLYVDDKFEYNRQTFPHSSPFSGGNLILGQSQSSFGSILEGTAMKGDIMHFNMWEHLLAGAEALDLYSDCGVKLGNLVQWPEINMAFRGNVTRTPLVRCLPKANYDWPLMGVDSNNRLRDQIKSKIAWPNVADDDKHTYLGVLTRTGDVGVSLNSYSGECLGNLDNCPNGLSLSFWMNYNALFVSYILGLRNEYYDALRTWLKPLMTQTARWEPCYRAVKDGFGAQTFHEKCPNHAVTVTLVKVGKYIFGGFADQRWGGTVGSSQYLWSRRAFLFSLVNPTGSQPLKLDVKPDKADKALLQDPQAGPVFGENDLFIGNNSDQSAVSFSDLGHVYELPSISHQAGTISARRFFAGTYRFIPDDIEVFSYSFNAEELTSPEFTATNSYEDLTYAPFRARPSSPNPWCAKVNSKEQYLQIDLGTKQSVRKIELIKRNNDTKYVKKYRIEYRVNTGGTFHKYDDNKKFDVQNPASVNVTSARYIRLYPESWENSICMRVRLYKKEGGNYVDLGTDNSSAIPDSSFTAKSWLCYSIPSLGMVASNELCYAAWCGQGPSTWLEINIGSKQMLVRMATRGPQQGNPVSSFYVEYSHDAATWLNYTEGGVRRIFYGNWDTTWVYHHFLPHLETQFLRIMPQDCGSFCCLNVKLLIPKDVTSYIIASFGESTRGEGFAVYHKYISATGNSSYHIRFATTQKIWSMELQRNPVIPFRWVHVMITWSEAWGLRYYENGRLLQKKMKFEVIGGGGNPYNNVAIGKAPHTTVVSSQPFLQLSDLIIRYSYLTNGAVKESVNLSDLNTILWYEQPALDFNWQQLQTDCTPSENTGPCHGETAEKFMFVESSFPRQKGDVGRLVTRPTIPTRNCFTFWYHMDGSTMGRLNLYLKSHEREAEVLIWRLTGSHGNAWKRGQIPILQRYLYQIVIEGIVGGYLGDIAVSDPVLSVNDSCSYTPEEARPLENVSGCRSALGIEGGAISDQQITASSAASSAYAYRGRLNSQNTDSQSGAWSASVTDENQWLQIDLGGSYYTMVTRVATQGRNGLPEWATKYKLQHSYNGVEFKNYKEKGKFTDKEFSGNTDSDTTVSHDLTPPIVSRYVRFLILTWSGGIAMRVELYGCQKGISNLLYQNIRNSVTDCGKIWTVGCGIQDGQWECKLALGMESGAISDMQIRGSSEYGGNYAAVQARLNYNVPGKFGGWSARTNDKNQWLQVDLLSHFTKVTRVATQGRRDVNQWVTKYNLKYSKNGLNFLYYRESRKRNDKVFAGNTDRITVVSHDLNPPITARFYRFLPLHWFAHISMRVELYGCHVQECLSALGMESAEISEKQISASSEYSSQLVASQSRLNIQPRAGKLGSWTAATNNVHQWLQVDLGVYSIVTRVATQGRHDAQQWVTKYKLMYGHHPSTLHSFKRPYDNNDEEFIGNINKDTVVLHDLSPPITARYVRFLPLEWISHISMRVELYGCHDTVCEPPCLEGQFCDEVLGRCVCDPTLRGEEWCKTRQRFSPLPIDKLLESAAFYWTMDNHRNIHNEMGSDYGFASTEATTIKGIRGKAVKVYRGSNTFTLNEGLPPNECLFNTSQCTNGFTLMLWVWYRHNDLGQVFLDSSGGTHTGHKMFQANTNSPQVAFQIASPNENCKVIFPTPKEIWTHYTLSYTSPDDLGNIKIFQNGKEVEDFVFKGCSNGSFSVSDVTRMSIGDPQGQLPEAAFDEIIIWYRSLTSADIATAYDYYRGDVNLLLFTNLHFTGLAWKANLSDHESETYRNWTKRLTDHVRSLYNNKPGYGSVTVYKYWDASGVAGCEFSIHFTDRGYSAVEPFINWLSTTPYQINKLEANDIFITAVSLHAQSYIKERSIDLSITWNGPTELSHGIFQGYELFYRDTTLGNETKVILRTTGDTFYVIQNLVPNTKYLITARSFTLEGDGKMSEPLFIWTAPLASAQSPINITALKLNSTSLRVTWTKISADQVGGVIIGYMVVFHVVNDGNSSIKSVVQCGFMNQTVLGNLQIFTNYSIRILGFTRTGKLGSVSDPVYAMTDEDVPSLPPSNVIAQAVNLSSIFVRWDPIPAEGRNGIIIGYKAWYRKMVEPPVWKRMEFCNVYWCEATNLEMNTPYRINVRGLTVKGRGPVASVEAITERGVPHQPLTSLTAHNTSSTSILVTLYPVSYNDSYEPIIAFELIMSTADNSSEKETITAILGSCENATKITHHQTDLQEYTAYRISAAGVTRKGFIQSNHKITVVTEEDIPEGSPQNITPAASSATSLTLSWKPLTNDKANGLILGYHILLFDRLRNITKNITVHSLDQANIANLFPYTEYEARIVPFNSKGLGNGSDVIVVRTKEAAPSEPPSNVTGVVPSSTSLTLDWKPVDPLHINGVLRAYVITYFVTNSPYVTRQNISIPVTSSRKRRDISDPSSQSYELSGLKKYTTYTIQVMAYTVNFGVPSDEMNLTTAQDAPSRPPMNVTAFNTSSTSINVTWFPVPDDHVNGILLGYSVLYRKADKPFEEFQNMKVCASLFEVAITNLDFFTNYEIRVLAFTVAGKGNISNPVFCMTDEDVPEGAPINLSTLPANTTAITVKWPPVAEEERNGYILGYWVSISNITGEFIKNVSVYGSDMLTTTVGGLDIWTNYSVQVLAFNVKGNGPWSNVTRGITDEEAPRVAPSNVTAFNTSSTSLHVTWQPISTQGLRGILRAYRVYYIEKETYFTRSLRNVTVDCNTLQVELVDLYKYTNYSVYVVARTNKDGVSSTTVNVSTDEDTPDRPPVDVVVWTPHSTSIHVSWREVPNGYKNGIIRGYKVHYTELQQNAPTGTENTPPFERSLSITGLKKFTQYNVTVLAYTSKGDGVTTSTVMMTDQDVPDAKPLNVRTVSTWTTHTIPLSWTHIPNHLLNGILTGYRIRYEAVEMGEYPYKEAPREVILPPGTVSTELTGLESFTVYRIELTGLTVKGDGPREVLFAETCRCLKRLTTNWMVLDPYVTQSHLATQGPGGLLSPFAEDMAVTCCQTCKTHGESYVDFEFNGKGEPALQHTEEALRLNILHATDLTFPVYGYKLQDKFRHEFGYTGIVESPGIAYVINTNYGNETPTSLVHAVFACWPLALMGILLAYIFGFIMWAVDQAQNTEHFPRSFFSGIWEGFWWAYVSMTTVGYGDRTPFSNVGKIVAIVWTLTGVVIIGILVGFIAVSLTSVSVGVDYKLYGANISAIYGSAEYNFGLRRNARFDKEKKHRNFEEIYELLSSNQISGVLIDGYVVGSRKNLFEKPFLRIYRVYDYSSVYGVVTGGNSTKLGKCFRDYIQQNIALIFQHVAENVEAIQESPEPLEVERSTGVFDSSSQLFRQNLMILLGALGVCILLGVVWEIIYRVKKRLKIQPQDNRQVNLLSTEITQMVTDLKSQVFKLALELKEKHKRQRRYHLTVKKNSRKYQYEQLEQSTKNSAKGSCEDEDLSSGIVAGPQMFQKAVGEQESQREQSPDPCLIENLAPFHVKGEKRESEA